MQSEDQIAVVSGTKLWTGRFIIVFLAILLLVVVVLVTLRSGERHYAKLRNPDLEYLKAVNRVGPPEDPQLLFILMTEFASSNLQNEGAEFFSARLREFEPRLTPVQKSLYLGIIGLLRAQYASSVPLLRRYGYVKDTIVTLDQAKQLSAGQVFVVNWIAGVVRARLPGYFNQRKAAQEELTWCLEHSDRAPHPAWLREIYFHLGKLALNDGDTAKAQDYLRRSGYSDFDHPITLGSHLCAEAHHRGRSRSHQCSVRLRIHGILLRRFQGPASTH
jgi:hypothetical protein